MVGEYRTRTSVSWVEENENCKSNSALQLTGFPILHQFSPVSLVKSMWPDPSTSLESLFRHHSVSGSQSSSSSDSQCRTWDRIPSYKYLSKGVRASCQVAQYKTNVSFCLLPHSMWFCEVPKPSSDCDWNVTVICNNSDFFSFFLVYFCDMLQNPKKGLKKKKCSEMF